ncbi:uncharacterized protein LOC101221597 isoform X3 [Cucumis sativus]|uniref:uncharacterized protein LOC101221597 isoform X3 n=1 Tax=Cucumis sativus TaxID=3659 RepID=UPI0012F4F450|nr:uncharacterized protein LOC101221597 isoform X3 [Cucumis sativus]
MCPNTMAPTNTTAPSEENKKKRSASASASSGEAQVQGDAKRSCHGSSSFPIDHSGFGSSVDNLIVGEGVNGFVEKWKEFEPAYRQKVFKDMNTMAQSILSPITISLYKMLEDICFNRTLALSQIVIPFHIKFGKMVQYTTYPFSKG